MYSTPGVSPTGLAPGTASGVVQQASTGIDGYHSTGPCSLRGDEASMGHSTEVSWGLPRMPGVLLLGNCTPRNAVALEMGRPPRTAGVVGSCLQLFLTLVLPKSVGTAKKHTQGLAK
jgi:hypothetical protein